MNTIINYTQLVDQLVKVFSNDNEAREYQNTNETRCIFCGWAGDMSPESRPAYIADFGADVVAKAEKDARDILANIETEYQESAHARATMEAHAHELTHTAPRAGSFVFGVHSGLKSCQGIFEEFEAAAKDPEWMAEQEAKGPHLYKVLKVYEVSPQEFADPATADKLVKAARDGGEDFPGGAEMADADANDNRRDPLNEYRYYYTLTAAVVCRSSGRWFLIDSEGYNYARYCIMPTNWREMFAPELAEAQRKEDERKAEEEKREAEEKAARLNDYIIRCAKYHGLLEDVRPLVAAEQEAGKNNGWHSPKYRKASRDLMNARKRNLVAMARATFPGLRVTAKKSDRWHGAFDVTYYDGPRLDRFDAATDYDLFICCTIGRDYNFECDEYYPAEFLDFAQKYMSISYGDFDTLREWSKKTRARLIAQVSEAVPAAVGSCYKEPYKWQREDLAKVAEATGANASYIISQWEDTERYYNYIDVERVARWCFDSMDFYTIAPTPEPEKPATDSNEPQESTTPAESIGTKAENADGLTMAKYSDRATVIRGYNADQLAELLAIGGKEWRNLKGGKGVIFSTRRHGEELREWMEAQQGEGTTAPAADQPADIVPAATLQEAGEISDTTNEPAAIAASEEEGAPVVPEFVALGSGRLVLSRNRVGGSGLVVRGYNAQQFADLQAMGGTYNPHLQSGPGVIFQASAKAAEVCAYIEAQELARLSKPQDLPRHTEEGGAYVCHAAQSIEHDTADEIKQGDRVIYNQFNGEAIAGEVVAVALPNYFINCDNGQGIAAKRADLVRVPTAADYVTATASEEPAAVGPDTLQEAGGITAPAFAPDIVAQARQDHPEWPAEFFAPEFFETEATDEHGHRIKKHSDIKEQAARIACNYLEGRGSLKEKAHRLYKKYGNDHPETVAAYERLQSRARLVRAAELEAYRTAGEARRAAWYREHSQQADTLEQGGEITAPALPEWVKDGARCQLMHKGQKLTSK